MEVEVFCSVLVGHRRFGGSVFKEMYAPHYSLPIEVLECDLRFQHRENLRP
jgi:hypothetical protein